MEALVRDPRLANDGLLIRVFRDEPARLSVSEGGTERLVGGRSGESAACAFYLEHRQGPRRASLSLGVVPGRSLSSIDIEGTVQEIELAIEAALPREWRGATVIAAGWGLGVVRLRSGVYLRRAGLADDLPPELEQRSVPEASRVLRRRVTMLREELIARRLVERGAANDSEEGRAPLQGFAPTPEAAIATDRPLVGWKVIADFLGVGVATARRWNERFGMPVMQPGPMCLVSAFPSALREWQSAQVDPNE